VSVSIWPFIAALVLVPVNWGLEILKWRQLTRLFYPLSGREAAKAVLTGVFFGLITPNRLGDAFGKIAELPAAQKPDGTYAFAIGSMAQGLVTLLFASIALPFASRWFPHPIGTLLCALVWIVPLVFILISAIFWKRIVPTRWLKWLFPAYSHAPITMPDSKVTTEVFILSALRYVVFATQFGLCLLTFGIPESFYLTGIVLVTLVYLFSSFIPSAVLGELGIRESIALIFISPLAKPGSEWAIIGASFALWCINLLLPGLVGAVLFIWIKKPNKGAL